MALPKKKLRNTTGRNMWGVFKACAFFTGWFDEIAMHVCIHYPFYILLSVFAKPENIRSIGLHETVGDCNAVSSQMSAIGQVCKV